ncbi:hypothetical protein A7D16_16230 [Xanthomonas nasturtii]|uniref:hypothetical protein n=1 Tax=Xanthomonas nasturtii TaxID=1843581 RepID=UPI0007E2F67E|nr:hypothetical protein [Xanthomonas nasturtii]OAX87257.1 hypothetical protein A7D16_16230 [Xanthomonas nasturtii]WVL57092.1 hypothetical protein M3O54_001755 [Xanthomonas nasturtii]
MAEATAISYTVSRGREPGFVLTPHLHEDGKYVASMTRFEQDYVRVESVRELGILAQHGFSIRMSSHISANHQAPSLISPGSLQIIFKEPAIEA